MDLVALLASEDVEEAMEGWLNQWMHGGRRTRLSFAEGERRGPTKEVRCGKACF